MPDTPPSRKFTSPGEAMRRAIELARRGIGHVEPNPPVGAVVVDQSGMKVGEGWHEKFGGPHAEVYALQQAGEAARGGTLYVTLEPCCHHGKTPPCTEVVIASGVSRVEVAVRDPASWVDGRGLEQLRNAGIDVQLGVESDVTAVFHAFELIAPFTKLVRRGLPWVHAKWAMSLDGKMATRERDSKWISNEDSRDIVHELRGRMDAILVGIGTAMADDPLLTARPPGARTALRVVLDSMAQLPLTSQLVRTARKVPVLLCVSASAPEERVSSHQSAGVEILVVPEQEKADAVHRNRLALSAVLQELGRRKLTHVLIEGGSAILGSAFDEQLVDEVHVFVAPIVVGGVAAVTPAAGMGAANMSGALRLRSSTIREVAGDVYLHGRMPSEECETD